MHTKHAVVLPAVMYCKTARTYTLVAWRTAEQQQNSTQLPGL